MSTGIWSVIGAAEALTRLKGGALGVDVRSQKEAMRGALQFFTNVPILHDGHRHQVGLAYKVEGQPRAIELGLHLVAPLRAELLARWRTVLEARPPEQRLLVCWRGGLRSQIAADWLAEAGVCGARVGGGYKAVRTELLHALAQPPSPVVLSGLTGTGKTELLSALPAGLALDLEQAARHRGSAFGARMLESQPSQQTFENELGLFLWSRAEEFVVEDEGGLIGSCAVPERLRSRMLSAPVVVLEAEKDERVRRIFADYVEAPLKVHPRGRVRQHLLDGLDKIARRLGGRRTAELRRMIFASFAQAEMTPTSHAGWIETLISGYYDPSYEYGLSRHRREILFRGDFSAVKNFLTHRLGGRRT